MTRDVLISLKGLQYQGPDNEQGNAELIVPGKYYIKKGVRYLIYDEPDDSGEKTCHTIMKIFDDRIEITRKGSLSVSMNFLKGCKNQCSYKTIMGTLMVGIDTTDIIITQPDDDTMKVDIFYNLDLNYAFYAECHMEMDIRSKDTAGAFFS